MACGVCDHPTHDRRTCPHAGPRVAIPGKRSARCECCGSTRYEIQRHHTRGRADPSDYLDLCADCHLDCAHHGDTQNLPIKPRVCRVLQNRPPSFWRR